MGGIDEQWLLDGRTKTWAEHVVFRGCPACFRGVKDLGADTPSKFKDSPWPLLGNGRCQKG